MNKNKVISTTLTVLSVAGVAGTAILAGKASIKANDILNKEEHKELPTADKLKMVAPIFVPTVAAGVATVSCIVANGCISKKHQAMLTSGYAAVNEAFKNYRQAVVDDPDAGEEKDKQYFETCRHYDRISTDTIGPDAIVTWYEPISDTYFDAYERQVMDAEYFFNRDLLTSGYIGVQRYFEYLGINVDWNPKLDIGWSIDQDLFWLDFDHEKVYDKKLEKDVYIIYPIYSPCEEYMEEWK